MINQKRLGTVLANVATALHAERVRRGDSMNGVAERAGLSQPMVSLVEREMRNPTLDTLLRISYALEVDLSDVLKKALQYAGWDAKR